MLAVGEGVTEFAPGDRVVPHHHAPCFACRECEAGQYVHCAAWRSSQLDPGGMAEAVRIPAGNLARDTQRIPDGVSDEEASFTEPLATVLKAFRRGRFAAGRSFLCVGLGTAGQLAVRVARASGAHRDRGGGPRAVPPRARRGERGRGHRGRRARAAAGRRPAPVGRTRLRLRLRVPGQVRGDPRGPADRRAGRHAARLHDGAARRGLARATSTSSTSGRSPSSRPTPADPTTRARPSPRSPAGASPSPTSSRTASGSPRPSRRSRGRGSPRGR